MSNPMFGEGAQVLWRGKVWVRLVKNLGGGTWLIRTADGREFPKPESEFRAIATAPPSDQAPGLIQK